MTIIYFVLILGITVFVHELGHFMFAKKFGVYVYEFSIGMGPRIFKFNRKNDETDYCIRLLPLGGFVQMAGEEIEENSKVPKDKQLHSKPAFQRFVIMIAGVTMNFLTAIVLLFFVALFNGVSLNNVYITNSTINGLNEDDRIVAINNRFVNNYDKLSLELAIVEDNDMTLSVKDTNGKTKNIMVKPIKVGKSGLLYEKNYGFTVSDLTILTSKIVGINENDTIININGVAINDYSSLLSELKNVTENTFILTLKDASNNLKDVEVNVEKIKDDELIGYSYGFYLKGEEATGFIASIKYAFIKFFSSIEQMIFTIVYLISGRISLGMLSGPVGIFNAVDAYSKYGISNLVSLLCLICINVGFINILPLPAFDGGHVVFIIIEKIKGSKVNPKIENTIHNIGFILLIILMIIVTYSDITRLF